jgi:predicted phage tail protein
MNPAMELLRASAGGPTALDAFLQTHDLTPRLATGVRELFLSFLQTDQFDNAELAASVLAVLWLRLGNLHEVLRNRLDHIQLQFRRAESAEEYARVRTHALDTLGKAVDLDEHEFAFRAAVLTADASFFGYRAGGTAQGLSAALVLADLVAASHRAQRAAGSRWLPRFVSLMAGAVEAMLSERLPANEQGHADRSFRQLAAEVGGLLPARRHFPDDHEKAAHVDALLKDLADTYGG